MENKKFKTLLDKQQPLLNNNVVKVIDECASYERVYEKDQTNANTSNDSLERKTMNADSTGIKQKSIPELSSMVD